MLDEREERRIRLRQGLFYVVLFGIPLTAVLLLFLNHQPLVHFFTISLLILILPLVVLVRITIHIVMGPTWLSRNTLLLRVIVFAAISAGIWLSYPYLLDLPAACRGRYAVIKGIPSVEYDPSGHILGEAFTLTISGIQFNAEAAVFPKAREPLLQMAYPDTSPERMDRNLPQSVRVTYLPHSRYVVDIQISDH